MAQRIQNRIQNRLRAKRFTLEQLEDRRVMAPITASLTGGVLKITGTTAADAITFNLSAGKISVAGVTGSWTTTTVNSITVDTLAGNDTVRLANLKTAGAFTKPIQISNSAGVDTVFALTGAQSSLAAGGKLNINTSSSPSPGGGVSANTTWIDSNIADAALKSLLKTSYADAKLDRREILSAFTQVSKDNVVSATEFSDLTKLANNAGLFTSVEYVGVLLKNVVVGNAANAKYQGTTLGNLAANATSDKLDKLVNKWFLGLDRPQAKSGSTTFAYATAAGSLFGASGPQYADVRQGAVGDCYFVGTLAEVALKSPQDIRNMFIVNGDGTYTVRFFNAGKSEYVTVDSALPTSGGRFVFANYGGTASSSSNVLWVALAEKAYAQINECGWIRNSAMGGGINAYQSIAGGWFSAAVSHIANKASTTSMIGSTFANDFETFRTSFDTGKMIGFASKSTPGNSQVVGGHQYVVVGYDATAKTVTLYNPWGNNNGSRYPGLVTLKWTDLAASFSYWDRTR